MVKQKYANPCICVFSVLPLPEVENWFWKQIWKESAHISILKKYFEEFRSVFKEVKKLISHCIFKNWFDWRKVFFLTIFFSEKVKHPKICLSLGGSMPEAQIKQCRLTTSSTLRTFLAHLSAVLWELHELSAQVYKLYLAYLPT